MGDRDPYSDASLDSDIHVGPCEEPTSQGDEAISCEGLLRFARNDSTDARSPRLLVLARSLDPDGDEAICDEIASLAMTPLRGAPPERRSNLLAPCTRHHATGTYNRHSSPCL